VYHRVPNRASIRRLVALAFALSFLCFTPRMASAYTYTALGASDAVGVGASPMTDGYVYLIANSLNTARPGSWTLINRGVSGYRAPDIENNTLQPAIADAPDVVTIFVGGDDVKDSVLTGESTASLIARFQPAYTDIINQLRTRTRALVITATIPDLSMVPVAAHLTPTQLALAHADSIAVNNVITSVAAANSVPVVDLFDNAGSYNPANFSSDGFHPNNTGYALLAQLFEQDLEPQVTTASPNSATPGTLVSLYGTGLTLVTGVNFGGTPAAFRTFSNGLVAAFVPAGAPVGSDSLTVTDTTGASVPAGSFTVLAPAVPTFTSISPGTATPGTLLYINGTGFTTTSNVTFDGIKVDFRAPNDGLLWVFVPAGAHVGSDTITVTNAAGAASTSFTVLAPSIPTITSISPGSATPGTLLYIYGTGLTTTSSVTFDGINVDFRAPNDGLLWVFVPAGAKVGSDTINITTAGGSVSTSFTVLAPAAPTVTSISPGSATPGTLLYVYGTGLTTTSSVTFDGININFRAPNDGLLWIFVPAGAHVGSDTINITTAGGMVSTSFTVLAPPAPTITSVSPGSGSAGTFVSIQGSAFATTSSVTFNGVKAYFQVANDNLLWTYVPKGASGGSGGLVVTNETGTASTAFTVTP